MYVCIYMAAISGGWVGGKQIKSGDNERSLSQRNVVSEVISYRYLVALKYM